MRDHKIHNAFHASLLKPYIEDPARTQEPPPAVKFADDHVEYEVERILNHRKRRGKLQYLVKWVGYADHENTWIPADELPHCQELIQDYHQCRDDTTSRRE